jgi:hypothetical protein
MVDIRPYMDSKWHVTVWLKSQCKNCKTIFQEKIFDYGILTYRELEKKMDETNHLIKKITCHKCGMENMSEIILYKDEIRNVVITESGIHYGDVIDANRSIEVQKDQKNRFKIFQEKEKDFWEQYYDYAIANWRDVVNELNSFEIREAYEKMLISTNAKTLNQLRKDVLNRFKTIEEKHIFWRLANDYFIYHHLLEIGALGWEIFKDIKQYGRKRMRFIILHFPLGESMEQFRTEWIGQVIKKNYGDNDFLFRRIAMLTDELKRTKEKILRYVHRIDELKAEKAQLEKRLSEAYNEMRKIKENKIAYNRDPNDVIKIHQLKSFINELIDELKNRGVNQEVEQEQKDEHKEIPVLEETQITETVNLNILEGKTVVIIGGQRQEQAQQNYVCDVLTHSGETLDPKFYQVLKQSDIIVVLTQFISHLAMWEAKAYAIQNDIPIHFTKGLNIQKILYEIVKNYKEK